MFKLLLTLLGYLLVICWVVVAPETETSVSATFYLEVTYLNQNQYAKDGWCDVWDRMCDVYFSICIWDNINFHPVDCDVASKKTPFISQRTHILLQGVDAIQIHLTKPVPKEVKFRVQVWDMDTTSRDDLIATFVSDKVSLSSHQSFTPINLLLTDRTSYNEAVNVTLAVRFTCARYHYGDLCGTHCKSDFTTFHCGEQGERKCLPGWRGDLCQLRDHCFHKPCAPHAQCTNSDEANDRICYCNGGSGPECYHTGEPCNPSPCENGGQCSKTGPRMQQFQCLCPNNWFGPTCSKRKSACSETREALLTTKTLEPKVCLNGGECIDHPSEFKYSCACMTGWKGLRCESVDHTAGIVVPIVVLLLLILSGILLFLFLRALRLRNRMKRRPTIEVCYDSASTRFVPATNDHALCATSNDIYDDIYLDPEASDLPKASTPHHSIDCLPPNEEGIRYASLLWDERRYYPPPIKRTKAGKGNARSTEAPQPRKLYYERPKDAVDTEELPMRSTKPKEAGREERGEK